MFFLNNNVIITTNDSLPTMLKKNENGRMKRNNDVIS